MLKVLLAEDDAANRDMLSRRLQRRDCLVLTAVHGLEAVRRAAQESVDIILMDIAMPELSGWEAVAQIRACDNRTPIIMLSAHAFAEERDRAQSYDVQGYLSKPIQLETLMELMHKLVGPEGNDGIG